VERDLGLNRVVFFAGKPRTNGLPSLFAKAIDQAGKNHFSHARYMPKAKHRKYEK
jgi:hypothetical protein